MHEKPKEKWTDDQPHASPRQAACERTPPKSIITLQCSHTLRGMSPNEKEVSDTRRAARGLLRRRRDDRSVFAAPTWLGVGFIGAAPGKACKKGGDDAQQTRRG
jgi:hypothetical protein